MINRLFNILFGCRHRHTTPPSSRCRGKRCEPYVACLDCGAEFSYNYAKWRRGERIDHVHFIDAETTTHS
jgi:hypothetical protein